MELKISTAVKGLENMSRWSITVILPHTGNGVFINEIFFISICVSLILLLISCSKSFLQVVNRVIVLQISRKFQKNIWWSLFWIICSFIKKEPMTFFEFSWHFQNSYLCLWNTWWLTIITLPYLQCTRQYIGLSQSFMIPSIHRL